VAGNYIVFERRTRTMKDLETLMNAGTSAQRARLKGAGNIIVATYTPTMPYSLYVNSKIRDPNRLKGGKIAISRFGRSSDFAARFIVSRLGLDPVKDVTIMQIGNQRERMSALLALRFGSRLHPIGLHQAAKKKTDGVYISVKEGGTMIEYEDEDPEIRRRFEANLQRMGTPLRMEPSDSR
jgi:hypothetical protein